MGLRARAYGWLGPPMNAMTGMRVDAPLDTHGETAAPSAAGGVVRRMSR